MNNTKVLFMCIGNMCRSPMAEAYAREYGRDFVDVYSAGTNPTGVVSEDSIELMLEKGIDIRHQRSNGLDAVPLGEIDIIVTMAPGNPSQYLPRSFGGRVIKWDVDDPIGSSLATFRRVRDEIDEKVKLLLDELRNGVR